MEIRDFVQAVSGSLIVRPDSILLASALTQGKFVSDYFAGVQPGDPLIQALSIGHVFLLTAGLGLVIGIGLTSSVAIGFFVVIGVAGGLFALESVLDVLDPQLIVAAQGVQTALASLVVQPYVADAYIVVPLAVFGAGLYRWNYSTKVKKRRAVQAVQLSMRQYCTFCGARHEPTASRCGSCGRRVEAGSGSFCADCGKPLSPKARYCGYCGAEVLRGEGASCQSCGTSVPPSARYCYNCGARIRSPKPPDSGAPPPPQP